MRIGRERAWISPGRRGFSLIEMTVVMWAVGILMLVGVATLLGALQVQDSAAMAHQRLALQHELADQFRTDVAEAAAAPDNVDNLQASPTCLLLRMSDGRLVAYRWHQNELERSVSKDAGTTRAWFPI